MASEQKVTLIEIKDYLKSTADAMQASVEDVRKESKAQFEALSLKYDELKKQQTIVAARPEIPMDYTKKGSEHKEAFLDYLRKGKVGMKMEHKGDLIEDTTGMILVPEELQKELLRALPQLTIMRGLASKITLSSNRQRIRNMDEVSVGWAKLETGSSMPAQTGLTPAEVYHYVEDLYGLMKLGEDELMDSDQNLEQYVISSFTDAVAAAEDNAFIAGTGHTYLQPLGVFDSTSGYARVSAGQAGQVTVDDFIKLVYELDPRYRQNGAFIVNSATEMVMRTLKDETGQFLWQPNVQAGKPNAFLGYPVYNQANVPVITNGSAKDVAAFGDFNAAYRILDHAATGMKRLDELYAATGMVGFRMHYRVGGNPLRTAAAKVLRVPA
jgi:HK97 family phage major capsid protein